MAYCRFVKSGSILDAYAGALNEVSQMSELSDPDVKILWSDECTWQRVLASHWKEMLAIVFLTFAITGFLPVMGPIDKLGYAISRTWFNTEVCELSTTSIYIYLAMFIVAGLYIGKIAGSLISNHGMIFLITPERIIWGTEKKTYSTSISSISSINKSNWIHGKCLELEILGSKSKLSIVGIAAIDGAANTIRKVQAEKAPKEKPIAFGLQKTI